GVVRLWLADLFSTRLLSLAPLGPGLRPRPRPSLAAPPVPRPRAARRSSGDPLADHGAAPDEPRPGPLHPLGSCRGRRSLDQPDPPATLRNPRGLPPPDARPADSPPRHRLPPGRVSRRRDDVGAHRPRGHAARR